MRAKPGWKPLPNLPFEIGRRTTLSSGRSGRLFKIRFFVRDRDRALVGFVRFSRICQGPPGHVHGGMTAMVLDESMGAASWLKGYHSVAAHLEFDYRRMVPVGKLIEVEAIARATRGGRKVQIDCSFRHEGKLLVRGRGVFVRLPKERIAKFLDRGLVL
jgi:acyl-coenzyme A thioesterase PaaI-like protein